MDPDATAEDVVRRLGLAPHPEGGYFLETWRSAEGLGTAILYLLTPEGFSAMHRLAKDEVWHHYAGASVEMLLLAEGEGRGVRLGPDVHGDESPQVVVARGTWQGARVADDGAWALVGCTVTPAFEYEDFELGAREELVAAWPAFAETIRRLTR